MIAHARDHYRSYSTAQLVEEARFKIHPELVEALIERLDLLQSSSRAHLEREILRLRDELATERRAFDRLLKEKT